MDEDLLLKLPKTPKIECEFGGSVRFANAELTEKGFHWKFKIRKSTKDELDKR